MRESAEHGADVGESESQCWPGLWRRQADTHGTIFTTRERGGAQVQVESIAQFSSVLIPDLPAKPCSVILRDIGLWTFALSCDKIRPHLLNPVPFESFAVVVIKNVTIGTCDVLRNRSIMR